MKEYIDLLQKILDEGVEKESGRENMPNTIGISKSDIKMDLSKGFPLLTTKKMYWKGIIHELLWFLRGETNIKYLVDNKVNIWNSDAYRWYLKYAEEENCPIQILYHNGFDGKGEYKEIRPFTKEEFIEKIKEQEDIVFLDLHYSTSKYVLGDLGKVYGHQWRNQNGVDQIKDVLDGLKSNPYSRYHIIDGWNKADFPEMALPPCHLLYQFIVRPLSVEDRWDLFQNIDWKEPLNMTSTSDDELHRICDEHNILKFYLDLNLYQRSCDAGCGIPFNLTSMSLFLMIIAKSSNMVAGIANWIGGDTHLYLNHLDAVKEQITRTPMKLPKMIINKDLNSLDDILNLNIEDFELIEYESYPTIKYELFVGLVNKS